MDYGTDQESGVSIGQMYRLYYGSISKIKLEAPKVCGVVGLKTGKAMHKATHISLIEYFKHFCRQH